MMDGIEVYPSGSCTNEIRAVPFVGDYRITGGSFYIMKLHNGMIRIEAKQRLAALIEGYLQRRPDKIIIRPSGKKKLRWEMTVKDLVIDLPVWFVAEIIDFLLIERSIGNMEI